jgi:ATP-dependent protease ClpP protease subunit
LSLQSILDGPYRENPGRALHVLGPISYESITRLTPEITRLRMQAGQPFTVYIDSPGGSTRAMDALLTILRTPDHDGREHPITTVVTQLAASAAADLLVSGDYAIAYPGAVIHYHGTRTSADDLSVENAQAVAGNLEHANEQFALRLGLRIITRLLFLLTVHRSVIDEDPQGVDLASPAAVMAALMERRLGELHPTYANWVRSARHQQLETDTLVTKLIAQVLPQDAAETDEPWMHLEVRLAKALLDYELQRPDRPAQWSLSGAGWDEYRRHFFQFLDFFRGEHRRHYDYLLNAHGEFLLSQTELADYRSRQANPEEAKKWRDKIIGPRMSEFWYFVVCLCRRLQTGENEMSARAAYWLGLVDEVLGSDLFSPREVYENRVSPPPAPPA